MSSTWEVFLKVEDFDLEKLDEIKECIADELGAEEEDITVYYDGPSLRVSVVTQFTNMFDPSNHGSTLTKFIWDANGEFCTVDVSYLCRENLPWENTSLNEEQYDEYVKNKNG